MTDEFLPLELPTDEEPCMRCGSTHLDTGWECMECGYDNHHVYAPSADTRTAGDGDKT